jgi:hypothetical protein
MCFPRKREFDFVKTSEIRGGVWTAPKPRSVRHWHCLMEGYLGRCWWIPTKYLKLLRPLLQHSKPRCCWTPYTIRSQSRCALNKMCSKWCPRVSMQAYSQIRSAGLCSESRCALIKSVETDDTRVYTGLNRRLIAQQLSERTVVC